MNGAAGPREALVRNQQRLQQVDPRALEAFAATVLEQGMRLKTWEVGVHLVGSAKMARVNWDFLQHEGPTDVITFDHGSDISRGHLHGELFICPAVAAEFACEFKTSWQQEVLRYLIHGLLHLAGYDDLEPKARARMKKVEHRLVAKFAPRALASRLVVARGRH